MRIKLQASLAGIHLQWLLPFGHQTRQGAPSASSLSTIVQRDPMSKKASPTSLQVPADNPRPGGAIWYNIRRRVFRQCDHSPTLLITVTSCSPKP